MSTDPIARLSNASLANLKASVIRPAYNRAATSVGVLHFGPGAFHRGHQAVYFDQMLSHDPSLAISAVSLHSDAVRQALAPQDGLYSLIEREAEPTVRVIGSVREILTAPRSAEAVLTRLADPALRFVTATVTEKGYCLTPDGQLDLDHPLVIEDLSGKGPKQTLPGWLFEGLRRRQRAGLNGLPVISCDNLSGNGDGLGASMVAYAKAAGDIDLAQWISDEVRFPNTMVDSITPATDESLRAVAAECLGVIDAWPIQRERFTQWVVADQLSEADSETFQSAGVTLTGDVAAFERAKLRLLNGAHSTLAYVGLAMGYESVSQAMADPRLAAFIERMMRQDIIPSLNATRGLDLEVYVGQILERFRNPAIVHKLSQIACDGSQKLPVRLLETIAQALAKGRPIHRLVVGVAAWMHFIRRQSQASTPIIDPMWQRLTELSLACTGEPAPDVGAFLTLESVFVQQLAANTHLRSALETAYGHMRDGQWDLALPM